ncbi:MAG: glycosyltransferase family 61 protein [Prosthecobacter sp.]|uniref:glycosyltransferase family 61 protein n=1 Tax=Prosthecobacter sp. TaxID=1965333 RepID=UPI0038FD6B52
MVNLARCFHDIWSQGASRLGFPVYEASEAEITQQAAQTWTLQARGTRVLDNALEHRINPACPATLDMCWQDVSCRELHHTLLTGDDGMVFLANGRHLRNCPSLRHHPDRKIRRPLHFMAQKMKEPCFYLAGRNYENHGHFLLHHLPRLMAAQNSFTEMKQPKILLGNRVKRWQERYLAAMGIQAENILRAGAGTTHVESLFYAPQIWTDTALADPEILHKLRCAFLTHSQFSHASAASQAPVLISRADAPDRKLLNEREIAAEVERQWGTCEVLELSKLDFATQLRKFATAPLILGALGQGFANLLVASGALCLILDTEEQWSESYFSRTFRDLALMHGNMAARLFAGRSIQKREHWSYPLPKFKQELATATALWKQHRSLAPSP